MNFLKRLLGISDAPPPPLEPISEPLLGRAPSPPSVAPTPAPTVFELPKTRGYPLNIVGESFYDANLESICGPRTRDGEDRVVDAVLILDDGNRHDPNAVRVEVNGLPVGHLGREDAPRYRAYLASLGQPQARGACKAIIKGGWKRGRELGNYGVRLSIKLPAEQGDA